MNENDDLEKLKLGDNGSTNGDRLMIDSRSWFRSKPRVDWAISLDGIRLTFLGFGEDARHARRSNR